MIKIFSKKMNNQKGFTLVELIVVIAILGILATIAVPKFSGFRETAAVSADEATATVIANAARIYYLNAATKPSSISIADLESVGLLEKDDYIPQQKDKTEFEIEVDGDGNITVGAITTSQDSE